MKTGDTVPDIELPDRGVLHANSATWQPTARLVLFFHPAAMTPGCTKEAGHFRDVAAEFAALGTNRVATSVDPVERQARFAQHHGLGYPLLSDTGGAIAARFGVKRKLLHRFVPAKSTTFVIDTDRTVLGVISGEFRFNTHADRAW